MTPDAIIESTRANVAAILKERFPQTVDFSDGSYALSYGSSSVGVVVRRYTETDTMVEIMAQVVSGAEITPELLKWLLRKNAELHFGAFGLLFDDTIIYTYSLPGSKLDASELEAAVTSVAVIADHYDDEIVKMAGGKRTSDL
ncbi:MAG: YbjN domain-containing protein [Ignavibacteria bacterium]|nr:YbjN domain-containing protein [Ignavibacteria bacterium]MBK7033449.1 YbjN domain-containing protein [Ignavibacteria bacterium]MBK7411109.1 YbjN domain-containing protein [Ignavibacteria bacterium]MBK7578134.1 YbjN domain-containing protein [Ignavibacteria bacterium]MBK9184043.1 YbjN domain-containing protein [Ignavibacteria bacterium]